MRTPILLYPINPEEIIIMSYPSSTYNRLMVREFAHNTLIQYENKNRNCQKFCLELVRKMYDLGLLSLIIPKVYGGPELPVAELIHVTKELAFGSASFAATFIGNTLGQSAVMLYASEVFKKELCQKITSQYGLWSFAMTEGEVGSDLLATKTIAVRTTDGFVLNGEKNFITNATYSTDMVVFARLFGIDGRDEGISCFYVPGHIEGLKRGPIMEKVGWHKANTGTLLFENIVLPFNYLIGEPGNGLRILTHCLNRSKTLLGGLGVGIAERAMMLAMDRLVAVDRYQKKLTEQPAIRHLLAKIYTKINAAWLLTEQAAKTWDAGQPAVKEASMAKLFSGATAMEVCSQTMELFGARGFFNEFEISRLIMDAKAIEIVEGPSLVQELLIAKEVLKSHGSLIEDQKQSLFTLQKSDLRVAA